MPVIDRSKNGKSQPLKNSTASLQLTVSGQLMLKFESGPHKGRSELLPGTRHEIGTGSNCDIRLKDPLASTLHCRLSRVSGRWMLEDQASVNGTFVNQRLVHRMVLRPGDEIMVGASAIRCEIREPEIQGSMTLPSGGMTEIPAMIAHELKNYLQFLDAGVEIIYKDAAGGTQFRDELNSIHYAREQIDQLVETLRAGCSPLHKRSCDLRTILDEQLDLLSSSLAASGIVIESKFPDKSVGVIVDPSKMGGAILNVLKNAMESITDHGTITIELTGCSEEAIIQVKDTGKGMDSATLSAMWLPLFTTRSEGSGLGAFMARTVVLRHGGRIWAESLLSQGTSIWIALPVTQDDDSATYKNSGGG